MKLVQAFQEKPPPKYKISPQSVQMEPKCSMRTDGRTDGRTDKRTYEKADIRFLQLDCERAYKRIVGAGYVE